MEFDGQLKVAMINMIKRTHTHNLYSNFDAEIPKSVFLFLFWIQGLSYFIHRAQRAGRWLPMGSKEDHF